MRRAMVALSRSIGGLLVVLSYRFTYYPGIILVSCWCHTGGIVLVYYGYRTGVIWVSYWVPHRYYMYCCIILVLVTLPLVC